MSFISGPGFVSCCGKQPHAFWVCSCPSVVHPSSFVLNLLAHFGQLFSEHLPQVDLSLASGSDNVIRKLLLAHRASDCPSECPLNYCPSECP